MDSILIKKFYDRIYKIIFLHFQYSACPPQNAFKIRRRNETGNIQSAFSGNAYLFKYCPFKLMRLDAVIYDMDYKTT